MTYQTVEKKQVDYYPKIEGPADVAEALTPYRDLEQEHFLVLHLNAQNQVQNIKIATIGLLNSCEVDVRETFCEAIRRRSNTIIIAHNHPSGDTTPSPGDLEVSKKMEAAGVILGITVLDHVIVTKNSYCSCIRGA